MALGTAFDIHCMWGTVPDSLRVLSIPLARHDIATAIPEQYLVVLMHSLLPQVVLSGHTIVVYEAALSLGRLVRCYSAELHPLEWDLIYAALEAMQVSTLGLWD